SVTTLAEAFRASGYVTAAFLTNPFIGRVTHLDQGFDVMVESSAVMGGEHAPSSFRVPSSSRLNGRAVPWLDRQPDGPIFLYVHGVDPHFPYAPPAPFDERYATSDEVRENQRDVAALQRSVPSVAFQLTRDDIVAAGVDAERFARVSRALYDAEVE